MNSIETPPRRGTMMIPPSQVLTLCSSSSVPVPFLSVQTLGRKDLSGGGDCSGPWSTNAGVNLNLSPSHLLHVKTLISHNTTFHRFKIDHPIHPCRNPPLYNLDSLEHTWTKTMTFEVYYNVNARGERKPMPE